MIEASNLIGFVGEERTINGDDQYYYIVYKIQKYCGNYSQLHIFANIVGEQLIYIFTFIYTFIYTSSAAAQRKPVGQSLQPSPNFAALTLCKTLAASAFEGLSAAVATETTVLGSASKATIRNRPTGFLCATTDDVYKNKYIHVYIHYI